MGFSISYGIAAPNKLLGGHFEEAVPCWWMMRRGGRQFECFTYYYYWG
jgi:hypothetical protein